ncbi:hypothetical protein PGT21_023468 [Puccinia graminis f. sp. tritici]|uniref:Uncharacterized protein n=1 Tax=Puccinia graminis f. sp. tritici TaxID=56615 RepID=A0A5B0PYB8_PUCGR|nr:hypothetical protein PGT21_023468 [Puccinia graminis f. sp. tritici]KAA1121032.1 hypothetical protein PGTUg99_027968 [Puccinia graminis f. sp. tritici]
MTIPTEYIVFKVRDSRGRCETGVFPVLDSGYQYNHLDAYLEATIKEYNLRGPGSKKEKDSDGKEIKENNLNWISVQLQLTKRMTLAIFGFIKLLLENGPN